MALPQGPRILTLDEVRAGTNQERTGQTFDSIESGLSAFIEGRRSSIPALPCYADPKEQKKLVSDCDENAPSLLAISAFLDDLLPKMDKTVLNLSQVQFETLSRVRETMGEDFVDDFTERCDMISVPVDVIRARLNDLKHRYLTNEELGASANLHTLLAEINTVYTEWIDEVVRGKFNNTVKTHLLPSNNATSEDDNKISEEEMAVWGLTHAVPAHATKQRTMKLIDMTSKNTPTEEVMALLGNKSRIAISHIVNASRNMLCYSRSDKAKEMYFDEGSHRVEGVTSLSRDVASTLSKYREIDQQLGFYLVDGAYKIIGAKEEEISA